MNKIFSKVLQKYKTRSRWCSGQEEQQGKSHRCKEAWQAREMETKSELDEEWGEPRPQAGPGHGASLTR